LQFASLYVGDLHPDITEAVLFEAFQSAGTVASCRICRDSVSRKSLGYGYVNYYNVEDAEKALETLNYQRIKGRSCRVMWSQRDAATRKDAAGNIFVKNLDESIDNKALHDTFSIFGHILSVKVATDKDGKSKGYGFVHYEAAEAAKQAIERVNGMVIGDTGTQVFVGPFFKRTELENPDLENFTNLYVKNLPKAWHEAELTKAFEEFGEVVSSVIMQNVDGKRFALVNFRDKESAKASIEALHRKSLVELGDTEPSSETAAADAKPEESAEVAKPAEAKAEGDAPDRPEDDEEAAADAELKRVEESFPDNLLYVQRAQTRAERRDQIMKERRAQRGGRDKPQGIRLCVRNLSEDTTSEKLKELFEPHGQVVNATAKLDEDGKCRGLGFVVFLTMEEATKAVTEMHLKVVDDKPLNVGLAERKKRGDGDAGEKGGKGKGGEDGKGKGKGKKEGKGKGKGRGFGNQAGGKGMVPGLQPPLPPGIVPGRPLLPPGMAAFPGPLPPGYRPPVPGMPRPATYSLPPAMSAGRPPTPGGTMAPPGMLLPGSPMAAAGQPGPPLQRPPFPFPPGAPGSPMHAAHAAMAMEAMMRAPPMGNPMLSIGRPPSPAGSTRPPPITREVLSQLPPQAQKQQLGERLFPLISRHRQDLAGKITGMMLELDNSELIRLLESESILKRKIDEAVRVLEKQRGQG
jgi:polyadenylate-binding protein